jgi:hypothetical protein
LAGVEKSKHRRWTSSRHGAALLAEKAGYGEIDLVRAAALDELVKTLKPATARSVWLQVEPGLDLPGSHLEVVVSRVDQGAALIREPEALSDVLPRGEDVIVVELHGRIAEARQRFAAFRDRNKGKPAGQLPAGPAAQAVAAKGKGETATL